jgi:2'-5' RNA ligase
VRLFVAVDVPEEVKSSIEADVVEPLRSTVEAAKWTRPEGRHLTLAFLGEVADDRVAEIASALAEATTQHRSFDASFDRLGGFPNDRRPRVLWVGIGNGADALVALQSDVADALVPLGFAREERPFHPHLTLARFQRPRTIEPLPSVRIPDARFTVGEVVLFRSQLHPKGARYTALERLAMGTT